MEAIGLIAGNGSFPRLFAQAAHKQGRKVIAVGMRGETLPSLEAEVDALVWTHVGQIRKMVRAFCSRGVRDVALAGGVDKRRLLRRLRPDWTALRLLARTAIKVDDSLLRVFAAHLESQGLTILDSTHFLPELMTPEGVLTTRAPTATESQDMAYGIELARDIGRLGIGQTVVVEKGVVLALEAIEGTDACIHRAGALKGKSGIVVKVAKPAQDMRFDVPAIGPGTLVVMQAAGFSQLAIEAGRTLLLNPQDFLREANRLGICVVGYKSASS